MYLGQTAPPPSSTLFTHTVLKTEFFNVEPPSFDTLNTPPPPTPQHCYTLYKPCTHYCTTPTPSTPFLIFFFHIHVFLLILLPIHIFSLFTLSILLSIIHKFSPFTLFPIHIFSPFPLLPIHIISPFTLLPIHISSPFNLQFLFISFLLLPFYLFISPLLLPFNSYLHLFSF